MSTAQRVPANTGSTAGAHFRTILGSGPAVVGGVIAVATVFIIGAAKHSTPVMGGGPAVVVLVVVVVAWLKARSEAENEFFNRWAEAHKLVHSPKYGLPELTPLLAGGDRRHCEHWMYADGRGIGWYTYEVRKESDDNRETYEPHDFTIATVDIGEMGMWRFQGIYLRRRRGVFERFDTDNNWLAGHRLEKVELESTAFMQRYELYRDLDQDPVVLRQLFAPSFVIWLAEHPLKPGFELRAGELVTFVPGHTEDAGNLEFLLMAAEEISKRIQTELTQAAQAGSI